MPETKPSRIPSHPVETPFRKIATPLPAPESESVLADHELYEALPVGGQPPIVWDHAEGFHIYDVAGNKWIDFTSGVLVTNSGHGRKEVVEAIIEQAKKPLLHSFGFANKARIALAKRLVELTPAVLTKVFLLTTGSESTECAIKLMRTHGRRIRTDKSVIVSFEHGFHGRTLGSTTATAQPKYHEGLGPLMAGFNYAPFGDLDAVKKLIDDQTAAIMIEPIQGEGGIRIPPEDFLPSLRQLCDENDLLLIFDEVQSGCGRTGSWFAYQDFGVTPDVMTLAKSLCGGIAGGAMLTTAEIAPSLRPGMHAATFGGNPIAARAGIAAIEMIEREGLLENARRLGEQFEQRLAPLVDELPVVEDVRVQGLMIGIELNLDGGPVVQACMDRSLLVNCTQGTVVRLLPAMNLSDEQLDEGCAILIDAIKTLT